MQERRYHVSLRFLGILGLGGIVAGLMILPESLPFDAALAGQGILSQLSVTAPAALAVLLASAVNLAAGSVVSGALGTQRATGFAELLLGAFVGAILLDVALLYLLAGLGVFNRLLVVIVEALVLVIGWRMRLGVFQGFEIPRPRISPLSLLIAVGWSAPILLQLASPVVPWADVLANHVAPVEHVRAFATFDPLTTSPSPVYGPSRLFLGYLALQGVNAVVVDMPASLVVSAYISVEVGLVGVALYRLAVTTGGRRAGMWILVTFMLIHPFARLADDRARVLALPLAAWTLIVVTRSDGRDRSPGSQTEMRRAIQGAAALAATLLMHPVIGALTAGTVLIEAAICRRDDITRVLRVVVAGSIAALPQALVMTGYPMSSVAALGPLALGLGSLRWMPTGRRWLRPAIWIMIAAAVLVVGWRGTALIPAFGRWCLELVRLSPLVAGLTVVGLLIARSRVMHPLIVAGLVVSALAGTYARSIPEDATSLLLRSLQFELQKEVIAWAPIFLALAAARTIVELLSMRRRAGRWRPIGLALVSMFILVAAVPLRPQATHPFKVGELRFSENLAIHLGRAQRGFWEGYPDARTLVDRRQQEILDVITTQIDQGTVRPTSEILHVAQSYQHWAATPVAVFTGMNETVVSLDAERPDGPLDSIHTVGGRLRPLSDLDGLLERHDQPYLFVLLEPEGLPAGIERRIAAAGYEVAFRNSRGTLFQLTDAHSSG